MRTMATRWSDEDIAASLNRMGLPTGQGKTWTAHRVSSVRRVNSIHAYRSAENKGLDACNTHFLQYEETVTSQRMEGMPNLDPSQWRGVYLRSLR